jgi:glutamate dehydrogenase (NAD(P)+)
MPCDILAPCAVDRVINEKNAAKIKCRILAEGANGPTTPEADKILISAGTKSLLFPTFFAMRGGDCFLLRMGARPASLHVERDGGN